MLDIFQCNSPVIIAFYGAFFNENRISICEEYMDGKFLRYQVLYVFFEYMIPPLLTRVTNNKATLAERGCIDLPR